MGLRYPLVVPNQHPVQKPFWTFNAVAGQEYTKELSVLPAGMYLAGFEFHVGMNVAAEGGGVSLDPMQVLSVLSRVSINNGTDQHLNLPGPEMAMEFKAHTGHNPILPDEVQVTVGNNTDINFVLPFLYIDPMLPRVYDTAYPTSLMQDGTMAVQINPDNTLADTYAVISDITIRVVPLLMKLNRAQIPPEVEVGYNDTNDMTHPLGIGNYRTIFATGFKKTDWLAFTNISLTADGDTVIASLPWYDLAVECWQNQRFVDDDDMYIVDPDGNLITKGVAPQPLDANVDVLDYFFAPIFFPMYENKLARLLEVDNSLVVQHDGTAHARRYVYRRYKKHTAAGVHARSRIMGYDPEHASGSRVNRRKLGAKDFNLKSILPIVFPKKV